LHLYKYMQLKISHIFYKKKSYIDKLANLTFIDKKTYEWFNILPPYIYLDFFFHNWYNLFIFRQI